MTLRATLSLGILSISGEQSSVEDVVAGGQEMALLKGHLEGFSENTEAKRPRNL